MPGAGGLGVAATCRLLELHRATLTLLVHWTAGWLPLVPRLEDKLTLASHLHEDAASASAVRRRLAELTGSDDAEHATTDDDEGGAAARLATAVSAGAYVEIAYGQVKPRLAAALRDDLDRIDPILDEPTHRVIADVRHRQELQVAERPSGFATTEIEERAGRAVMTPASRPARDPFVEVRDEAGQADDAGGLHALLHAELCRAEVVARALHEAPGMPWEFHAEMARRCWDHARHAAALDRHMTLATSERWGSAPVTLATYAAMYDTELAGRLTVDGPEVLPPGLPDVLAEHLLADAARHQREAVRWVAWPPSPDARAS